MTLLSVSFFYLLAGSAGFIRQKLDPKNPNVPFDTCMRWMFRGGVLLLICGILSLVFPSIYWQLVLVPIIGTVIYQMLATLNPLIKDQTDSQPK